MSLIRGRLAQQHARPPASSTSAVSQRPSAIALRRQLVPPGTSRSVASSTMAQAPSGNVPGLVEQAKTVAGIAQSTLTDKEKREALAAELQKHITELAALTKEHVTDADKRSKLLGFAKNFASQAISAAKDPHQRQVLLDMVKATAATVQEAIKDPAKRQEIHDQLAAATYSLLVLPISGEAGAAPAAAAPAAEPAAAAAPQ